MEWTKEQQKVIELRKRNILVSAAAGSGKTAVLVERIIAMITEGSHPIDIDHLLVVTFTNAAAGEMKERISKAIEDQLRDKPDNKHLQKQMTLVHNAQITTIDSFCMYIVRNYFHRIDLDPGFRMADEGELQLLQSDVIGELLEKKYEEADTDFLEFIECYSTGKSDDGIEDLILQLYKFSVSYPWPKQWLEKRRTEFSIETLEEMEQSDWMESLLTYLKAMLKILPEKLAFAIGLCQEEHGPKAYLDALYSDKEWIEYLIKQKTYQEYSEVFSKISWEKLKSIRKSDEINEELKLKVKEIRDDIKKVVEDIKKKYFFQEPEQMLNDIKAVRGVMNTLVNLALDFTDAYQMAKEEKELVDFSDIEHFALQILTEKEENEKDKIVPSDVAKELSEYYEEIMIDEYQDSNLVQEMILNQISKQRLGVRNVFMVGDVKQSIYRFRLARPELFMEKYITYPLWNQEESKTQRIDLHKNFRSREVVLDTVNFIFQQIMITQLGGISYDDSVALHVGMEFEPCKERYADSSECIFVYESEKKMENIPQENTTKENIERKSKKRKTKKEMDPKELEARAIAARIKELVSEETGICIWDKNKSEYRRAGYGDIVILLRSVSGWSEVFTEVFMAEGILTYTDTQTGYFSAMEIRTVLNLLQIIDNPRQDIPLTSVLYSPMFAFTGEELAMIRSKKRPADLYDALLAYIERYKKEIESQDKTIEKDRNILENKSILENTEQVGNKNTLENTKIIESKTVDNIVQTNIHSQEKRDVLKEKIERFLEKLEKYRQGIAYKDIHQMIEWLIEDTGFYQYISVLPGGEKRKANLDMLVQKAIEFENTSYRGLFHFNRYMEKLQKYEIDFGEAGLIQSGNAVRIMSIHKSKGLEFPIVFVAAMGKLFNQQDARSKLVLHPDLGMGPDFIDSKLRIKAPTLIKRVVQKNQILETLGEELRVLYVALTRAKEKLILTGYVKKKEETIEKWKRIAQRENRAMEFSQLSSANQYWDWIGPAIYYPNNLPIEIKEWSLEESIENEVKNQISKEIRKENLLNWDIKQIYDNDWYEKIHNWLEYKYPYDAEKNLPNKLTVTELKKMAYQEEEATVLFETEQRDEIELLLEEEKQDKVELLSEKEKQDEIELLSKKEKQKEADLLFETEKQEELKVLFGKEQQEIAASLEKDNNSEAILEKWKGNSLKQEDKPIPNFMKEEVIVSGARRGVLYHKMMQKIVEKGIESFKQVDEEFKNMIENGTILQEEIKLINKQKIWQCLQNNIIKRMIQCKKTDQLYCERQFMMGIPAKEIYPNIESQEFILVQGMIDAYFEEEDGLVLVDYKTDYVGERGEIELIEKYKVQLDYYQHALEKMTHKKVKERYLYSFFLGQEVKI